MAYSTDVTDAEWELIGPLLLTRKGQGPRKYPLRTVYNAVQYQRKHAVAWRDLPADFPPWAVVHQQHLRWAGHGVYARILRRLTRLARVAAGHEPEPSILLIDSQSVKSTPESGQHAGFDGGKKGERSETALTHRHARAALFAEHHPGQHQ